MVDEDEGLVGYYDNPPRLNGWGEIESHVERVGKVRVYFPRDTTTGALRARLRRHFGRNIKLEPKEADK
jgi:hypothetical protein